VEKIQELVKDGKFAKSLMSDKEFVDGAKEIFKSEHVDMDDKKLAQLMDEIEAQLKKGTTIDDEELANVAGGVTARGAVVTASSVIGAAAGALVTSTIFPITEVKSYGHTEGGPIGKKGGYYSTEESGTKLETNYGAAAGTAAAGVGGGYVGYRLGQWICDKAGIK
jgi:hypothetical protein